jgi:hypothetical protein
MTAFRRLALVVVALLLFALGGAAWYFFGSNGRPAAELVPGDTLAFALISNGAGIGADYETSKLRQLVEAPEAQPLLDSVTHLLGDKNLALLHVLGPDLSGQSFIAITHLDPDHPTEAGFIAGMRPKFGTDHFDEFVQQVNTSYPDLAQETKTGHDTLLGVDYQWIEGNNAPGRVCVARYRGWIVTTWGEAALQDWLERMQGKSTTPSLADNADFTKSRDRVGSSQGFVYLDYPRLFGLLAPRLGALNPALVDHLKRRFGSLGGAAVGTSFQNGEIVDHFSLLEPKQAQLDNGLAPQPCPFETLKFTGPDTRFYFGASLNWPQVWKNLQEQLADNGPAAGLMNQLNALAQAGNIDLEKNVIDALGSEYSVQLEWAADAPYPDLGIYFKVDKPDDFKPAVDALIDLTRREFATTAVINEMEADGHHFATLKMVQPMPVSPTITEDGPYFGFFLNETHAVRALARDETRGLLHNDDFNRQVGNQRDGANQLIFLDAPRLFDQAYRTAQPYLAMGAMINPQLASLMQNHKLPADLAWLAPMGTWTFVSRSDDDGISGSSISGIGNQGILLAGGLGAVGMALQQAGLLPQHRYTIATPGVPTAPAPAAPGVTAAPAPMTPAVPPAASTPSVPSAPSADASPAVPPAPSAPPAPPDATTPPSPPASTH